MGGGTFVKETTDKASPQFVPRAALPIGSIGAQAHVQFAQIGLNEMKPNTGGKCRSKCKK
jgi:hypothetical protein